MKIIEFLKTIQKIPPTKRVPTISDENLEDLINQIDMTKEDERYTPYPILGTRPQQYIPFGLLLVHEGQAWKNHGQSLSQLAKRGGISWAEALAIMEGKVWRDAEHDENTAENIVKDKISDYVRLMAHKEKTSGS